MDPFEFFSTKLYSKSFVFAQYIKSFFRNIGNEVAKTIHFNHMPCNLFFGGLYLAVNHLLKRWHWLTNISECNAACQLGCSRSKDVFFRKGRLNGVDGV